MHRMKVAFFPFNNNLFKYRILVISGLVSFVVHMFVFLLEIELDPIMEAHDLLAILGFADKHVFKPTGILTRSKQNRTHISVKCIIVYKIKTTFT